MVRMLICLRHLQAVYKRILPFATAEDNSQMPLQASLDSDFLFQVQKPWLRSSIL